MGLDMTYFVNTSFVEGEEASELYDRGDALGVSFDQDDKATKVADLSNAADHYIRLNWTGVRWISDEAADKLGIDFWGLVAPGWNGSNGEVIEVNQDVKDKLTQFILLTDHLDKDSKHLSALNDICDEWLTKKFYSSLTGDDPGPPPSDQDIINGLKEKGIEIDSDLEKKVEELAWRLTTGKEDDDNYFLIMMDRFRKAIKEVLASEEPSIIYMG